MAEIIILSIASFISTNIDDLIISTFFFSSAMTKREIYSTVAGKYIGTGLLVLFSAVVSLGIGFLPLKLIGFLGLVPIALGIKEILKHHGNETYHSKSSSILCNVILVTVANGADNLGVYIPLLSGFSGADYAVFLAVFILMTALWCVLGYKISTLPFLKNIINKYRKIFVPIVYILLGIYILIKNFL